ncbi:MAG: zinc-ribbon domain-containing protein, partial [Rhodospirillales bacterium]|nr:zinc-ribbon domain-containing protein [Rhodospirillales bacterium]
MTSRKRRKPAERAKPTEGRECPSCGTALLSEARFCHACGTALDGSASGGIRSVRGLAWGGALVVVVALVVFAAAELSKRYGASSPPSSGALSPPRTAAPAAPNRPPDLSQMTPRGAADRLFNRIMTANEQGNLVEALRFVPMAVQAYGALPELDGDAHYHLGLIHELAGDNANLEAQITALRK